MIAITPSVNASRRPLLIVALHSVERIEGR
jgi:hypothetical protein